MAICALNASVVGGGDGFIYLGAVIYSRFASAGVRRNRMYFDLRAFLLWRVAWRNHYVVATKFYHNLPLQDRHNTVYWCVGSVASEIYLVPSLHTVG